MEAMRRLGADGLAKVMTTYRLALQSHREAINRLNVYPVPDGDTGTNMALTLESVVKELSGIEGLESLADTGDSAPAAPAAAASASASASAAAPPPSSNGNLEMAGVCKAIAHGSLMGARGNSGVILSQLLRGFTGVLSSNEDFGGAELAQALEAASVAAYQAVLRPVEGTILTVAKAAAEGATTAVESGGNSTEPDRCLLAAAESARSSAVQALDRTPDLLPVLAQAGVVDAGGSGYVLLMDALLSVLDGRPLPDAPEVVGDPRASFALDPEGGHGDAEASSSRGAADGEELHSVLRYEVMYFLEAPDESITGFKDLWEGIGDSIVVVGGDGLWNCHIHTDDVGAAVEACLDVGRPRNIRVSDLSDQIEEERWVREAALVAASAERERTEPRTRTAVVAVANGEGVGRIFHSLGVHHLVPGGQSMNPSTAQILEVVDSLGSDEVVILPNNENIVPVAMQVCELSDKTVRVVPTSGIVEGFAALLEYDPGAGAEENASSMAASARRVVAGEVTQAIRDASGPAGPIKAGEWMGLSRDGVEVVGSSMAEASCGLLGKLLSDEHELVTIIEGEGAAGGQTRQITEWLAEHRPQVSVEVHHGGQPLYPYLFSIE